MAEMFFEHGLSSSVDDNYAKKQGKLISKRKYETVTKEIFQEPDYFCFDEN